MPKATAQKSAPKQPRNRWLILALVALAQFVVVLDTTIVNVALPSMQRALNISPENLQWIITAYTLAFGGFLLLGGRVGDLIGRRKTFIAGITVFSLASLAVGVSANESLVIVARGAQGLAAAFMSPAALGIVLASFKEGAERNKALSIWGGISSGGAAAGLLLGGILTQYLGWRWNFFVNVPLGLMAAFLAYRIIPESKGNLGHNHFDILGSVTVTSGLMLLVFTLSKVPQFGWGATRTVVGLVIAALLLAAFLWNEHKSKHPLMPLSIFTTKNVGRANLVMFPIIAGMFAVFFFLTLYVQNILGYDPLKTGFAFLPVAIVIGIVAGIASQVVTRVGYKPFMVAGPLLIAAGMYWLSALPIDGSYWVNVFPPLVTFAVGMGLSFIGGTIAATNGVSAKDSGLASGLLNTTQQVGGAVGLAVLSVVATSGTKHYFENLQAQPTQLNAVNGLLAGFQDAFLVATGLCILASIIALIFIKQKKGEKIEVEIVPGA